MVGWALYDAANSAYATSVMSVIFGVYFVQVLVPAGGAAFFGFSIPGESLWSYLISSVMAVVIVLSPSLGALADHKALKRPFLMFWAVLGILATMALFGATPGRLLFSCVTFFLATAGYEMSLVFYNAFLTDVSDEATSGRVSGLGFAVGYVGGGLCLALNMVMIAKPDFFGLASADDTLPVRAGILVVGLWWLVFSLPMFAWVKDRAPVTMSHLAAREVLTGYFRQFRRTWGDLRQRPELRRFTLSYFLYNDGIQTVILMASIFGAKELGMSTAQLGLCYLVIQFVAFVGAMAMGRAADAWSHKNVVLVTLIVFCGVSLWALVINSSREFWILGIILGVVLGGSQAASRSLFSILIPARQAGEFFAIFSIVGKAGSLMGPLLFGAVSHVGGLRAGVFSLVVFFIAGGVFLLRVDEARGRAEALAPQ